MVDDWPWCQAGAGGGRSRVPLIAAQQAVPVGVSERPGGGGLTYFRADTLLVAGSQ